MKGEKMAQKEEYLAVEKIVNIPLNESAGHYRSKFFSTMRDEKKIIANKCPQCNRIILPPRIICLFCKVEVPDSPENWVELSDKGTIVDAQTIQAREQDAVTGELIGQPNPNIFIRLDGGDEWTFFAHISEEMDPDKVKPGGRVRAVWKPKDKREGKISDILYFRIIKD